ncbi:hypothetical protein Slin15195_G130530 [Septoria linicola]|uniref:Uncharacterized protein n=1 Tax=Septoria linicola TaxID=215465 RepID=A0A9Q9B2H1_9PEZI|nr:hypothetical protein Slin15195_G130530 [Septoria linicola]
MLLLRPTEYQLDSCSMTTLERASPGQHDRRSVELVSRPQLIGIADLKEVLNKLNSNFDGDVATWADRDQHVTDMRNYVNLTCEHLKHPKAHV